MWLLQSSPAATCKQGAALARRDTLAAAPGLLAHASATETVKFLMGAEPRHTSVMRLRTASSAVRSLPLPAGHEFGGVEESGPVPAGGRDYDHTRVCRHGLLLRHRAL